MAGVIAHTVGVIAAAGGNLLNEDLDGQSYTISDGVFDPNSAQAEFGVLSDGSLYQAGSSFDFSLPSDWTSGNPSSFEVQATVISGSVSSGPTGSFVSCSSNRIWTRAQPSAGASTVELEITIRNAAATSRSVTFNVTLQASVSIP